MNEGMAKKFGTPKNCSAGTGGAKGSKSYPKINSSIAKGKFIGETKGNPTKSA